MRRHILILLLCGIFFLLPLHFYIISGDNGIGIQGAVFRYQISGYGNSFITITSDVMYILNGVYSGRTALSIILWGPGTLLLAATIIFGFAFVDDNREDFYWQISLGLLRYMCLLSHFVYCPIWILFFWIRRCFITSWNTTYYFMGYNSEYLH